MRIIALLFFIMCSVGVNAQQVKLSRLERAAGAGYVPYTDVNGKQAYNLLSTLLPSYVTGSGTVGDVAVFSSASVVTSTGWNMDATRLQGGTAGDPRMDITNNIFTFNNDTDNGFKYFGPDDSGIVAGDLTNPVFFISGSGNSSYFDLDDNGSTEWNWTTSEFYCNLATFSPLINSSTYSFKGDTDTGIKRTGADIVGIHAGDATNPSIKIDGVSDFVYFDPDDDGTNDVTISATKTSVEALTASGTITADGSVRFQANSTSNNVHLVGTDATNFNTRVIVDSDDFEWGDGTVYDTLKLAAANTAHLFAYDDNAGSSQTFSLTGAGTYDTLQLATTGQLESGVKYGPPNPSADSAIIFTYAGTYLVSFDFTGELSTATTNQTLRTRWNANSGTPIAGGAMSYGFETTARQTYTQTFIYQAAANDYLQLMATIGTGGAATLTVVTPKITVTRIK